MLHRSEFRQRVFREVFEDRFPRHAEFDLVGRAADDVGYQAVCKEYDKS